MHESLGSIELGDPERVIRNISTNEIVEAQVQTDAESDQRETSEPQRSLVLDKSIRNNNYLEPHTICNMICYNQWADRTSLGPSQP